MAETGEVGFPWACRTGVALIVSAVVVTASSLTFMSHSRYRNVMTEGSKGTGRHAAHDGSYKYGTDRGKAASRGRCLPRQAVHVAAEPGASTSVQASMRRCRNRRRCIVAHMRGSQARNWQHAQTRLESGRSSCSTSSQTHIAQ